MNAKTSRLGTSARITWAIAAKDIVDALKNKNTLANIISVFLMMMLYSALPVLEGSSEPPRLWVYDAGSSSLVEALAERDGVDVRVYPAQEMMEAGLSSGSVPQLGLAIPADFDQRVAAGEPIVLAGYVQHWVGDEQAEEVRAFGEQQLAELAGGLVSVDIEGNRVYPGPDGGGRSFMVTMSMMFSIVLLGTTIIPHLMIEEKQTKTLDALLVSPASAGQIVAGKALAGLFYCLTAAAVMAIFYAPVVLQWGVFSLAVVAGSLFSVILGLMLGMLLEVRQQLTLWGFLLLNVLFVPMFLTFLEGLVPENVIAVLSWVPSAALAKMFNVSLAGAAPLSEFGLPLAIVVVSTVGLAAVATWLVRRSDR